MRIKLIYLTTCFSIFLCIQAQNEASKWYFGHYAALDFMTNPPTALNNSTMVVPRGSGSIADAAGNLMFYTDGYQVWNKQHLPMANGSSLTITPPFGMPGASGTQVGLSVKQPGNNSLYYIFSMDGNGASFLRYAVVDMSLAAGMGSVTTKQNYLFSTITSLAATKHTNGQDLWVVCHEYGTDTFRSYLITAAGINTVAVITQVGPVITGGGTMKISPTGRKLGITNVGGVGGNDFYALTDFDKSTGIVSNFFILNSSSPGGVPCEFSPDGGKFYASETNGSNCFFQWDLCAGSNSAIIASQYTFAPWGCTAMQLAQNGKIYASSSGNDTINVIDNPNTAGAACNYSPLVQPLSNVSTTTVYATQGFPGIMSSYLKNVPGAFAYSQNPLFCSAANFTPPCISSSNYTAVTWLFGDPASGASNTSTLTNPDHIFTGPGAYTVKLVMQTNNGNDTVSQIINFPGAPLISLSGKQTICKNNSTLLTASGANTYSWSNGITTSSVILSPTVTTIYTVTGTHTSTACMSSKILTVTVQPCTALNEINSENDFVSIYPNPGNGEFILETGLSSYTIKIYNQLGLLCFKANSDSSIFKIDLKDFDDGLYFVELSNSNLNKVIKLIKTQ